MSTNTPATGGSGREHRHTVAFEPAPTLRRLAEQAQDWGGEWNPQGVSGGRLALPVLAGLRRGWVGGPVVVDRQPEGTMVTFREEAGEYRLDLPAVVTLVIAALGCLVTVAAPFVPALWSLVPLGVVLALAAWLFIVARLRNSGPEEFFAELVSELSAVADGDEDGDRDADGAAAE